MFAHAHAQTHKTTHSKVNAEKVLFESTELPLNKSYPGAGQHPKNHATAPQVVEMAHAIIDIHIKNVSCHHSFSTFLWRRVFEPKFGFPGSLTCSNMVSFGRVIVRYESLRVISSSTATSDSGESDWDLRYT